MVTPKQTNVSSYFRLPGVGKQIAKHLARLEIYSIQDLLFHLPVRYQDRTKIESIRQLTPGNEAVIEGVIKTVSTPRNGRTKLLCELKDETGKIFLRFFHAPSFLTVDHPRALYRSSPSQVPSAMEPINHTGPGCRKSHATLLSRFTVTHVQ